MVGISEYNPGKNAIVRRILAASGLLTDADRSSIERNQL